VTTERRYAVAVAALSYALIAGAVFGVPTAVELVGLMACSSQDA